VKTAAKKQKPGVIVIANDATGTGKSGLGFKAQNGDGMSPTNQPLNYVSAPFDFSAAEGDDASKKGKGKKFAKPFGQKGSS